MGIIILSDLYAMVCLSGEALECTSLHDTFPNRQSYSVYWIFIVPYLVWFVFIAVTVAYFLIKDKWGFYRLCAFLFSGMTIFLIICTVFPNALNLRPTVFPRDNVFTDMVKVLYKTDTSTNVLPSIHVFNSIGVSIAISHSNDLKTAFRDGRDCSCYDGMYYLSIRVCDRG